MHDSRINGQQLELSLEELVNGEHEQCHNPMCRMYFAYHNGAFIRTKGLDGKYYCDEFCASGPYLTRR